MLNIGVELFYNNKTSTMFLVKKIWITNPLLCIFTTLFMQNFISFEFVNNYLPRRGNIIVKIGKP